MLVIRPYFFELYSKLAGKGDIDVVAKYGWTPANCICFKVSIASSTNPFCTSNIRWDVFYWRLTYESTLSMNNHVDTSTSSIWWFTAFYKTIFSLREIKYIWLSPRYACISHVQDLNFSMFTEERVDKGLKLLLHAQQRFKESYTATSSAHDIQINF